MLQYVKILRKKMKNGISIYRSQGKHGSLGGNRKKKIENFKVMKFSISDKKNVVRRF